MYTEDGFELRPLGDTMEIYASGEQFHQATPPVAAAFEALSARMTISKVLCDVRMAAYILEPGEIAERAHITARILTPFRTAFVCLADQRPLIGLTAANIVAQGGNAAIFSSKSEARDWLTDAETEGGETPRLKADGRR
jgi:hypothetical protein